MFGLFKRKAVDAGPITFDFEILIDRPADQVYPLVDWADPRNAKRQLGHRVEGSGSHFVLIINSMPDHRFAFDVTEAVPNRVYAFSCDIQPRVGRLANSHETYELEERAGGSCLLRLVNQAQFIDGLTMRQLEQEMVYMSVATNDALAKIKVLAEEGLEAARSLEN